MVYFYLSRHFTTIYSQNVEHGEIRNDWWSSHRVFFVAQQKILCAYFDPGNRNFNFMGSQDGETKCLAINLFKQTSSSSISFSCCHQFNSNPFTSAKNQESNETFLSSLLLSTLFKAFMSMTPDVKHNFPPTPIMKLHWHQDNKRKAVRLYWFFARFFSKNHHVQTNVPT